MLRTMTLCALVGVVLPGPAVACPTDTDARAPGVWLTVRGAGPGTLALNAADLARLPITSLTQRQTVTLGSGAGAGAGVDHSTVYAGVLLRDVLAHAGFGAATDRGARAGIVEAVATDGYRAVFSWGELFNASAGQQALVITTIDGRPLDAAEGPLALRALADLRPGPRHVRNLCGLVVRR